MQKVLLVGGSGKQSSAVYLPILLDSSRHDLKLVAIADPIDPTKGKFSSKHTESLIKAGTKWIKFTNQIKKDLNLLNEFFSKEQFDILAVSCPPLYHAPYIKWGLQHGVDIIVDKPFICSPFQFGNPKAPSLLRKEYTEIQKLRKSSRHWNKKRACIISVPLMRRVFTPYTTILEYINQVYEHTDQHLTHIITNRSDGCFRFADEFDRPGAHGYRDGLGTLTQSAYHYLDYMAACVMAAPPKASILEAEMTSKYTVGSFRKAPQNTPYSKFLGRANKKSVNVFNGDNAELDFSVNFSFKKPGVELPFCSLNLTFVQSGCSRRISPHYATDATHDEGLTNDCVMVIHQGQLQSIHWLVAQDGSSDGRMTLVRRVNPLLAEKLKIQPLTITDFPIKSNENILRNQKIINGLLENFANNSNDNPFMLLDGKYQDFTMELYIAAIRASIKKFKSTINFKNFNPIF